MSSTLPVLDLASETAAVRFHLSLNVDDLARSVAFFALLFDRSPAKHATDYAKFELDAPPLVLSLEPHRAARGGKLNHLGFRLPNSEALVEMQRRLELHGVTTSREDGVECCYARQTKFWITDPDGNLWEFYTVEEDLGHRGTGSVPVTAPTVDDSPPARSVWQHRLGEPLPKRIFAEAESVDEVILQGTFHAPLAVDDAQQILLEVARVLKSAGRVTLHQLTARQSISKLSQPLPGPAAAIEFVPSAEQLAKFLETAGFVAVQFEKIGDAACFVADGVECRETLLVGKKPVPRGAATVGEVLYKGPHREICDDLGNKLRRGEWNPVDRSTWESLQKSAQQDCAFRPADARTS